MIKTLAATTVLLITAVTYHTPARAVTFGFTESFETSNAGWSGLLATQPLDHSPIGGVDDGGHVDIQPSTDPAASALGGNGPVIFRAPASASGGAFTGNWLTSGVSTVQAYFRHSLDLAPVNIYVRMAGAPGAGAGVFFAESQVEQNDGWTLVNFDVTEDNFTVAGGPGTTYAGVLGNVTQFQFGAQLLTAVDPPSTQIHFELDQVSLVPEPSSLLLVVGMTVGLLPWRRRRTRSINLRGCNKTV
jgi:hypothetical protein